MRKTISLIIILALMVTMFQASADADGKRIENAYSFYPTKMFKSYEEALKWKFDTEYVWQDEEEQDHCRHSIGFQYKGYDDIIDLLISHLEEAGIELDLTDGSESPIGAGYLYGSSGTSFFNGRANKIVKKALAELGTAEEPLYSNHIKYNTDLGYDDVPWDTTFISWLAKECELEEVFGESVATCQELLNNVQGDQYNPSEVTQWGGSGYTVKPGDLVFWFDDNTAEYTHVGIVTHVDNDHVMVTQGNTSSCKVLETEVDPSTNPFLASGKIVHVEYPGYSFDGETEMENIIGFLHEEMGFNKAAIVGILVNMSAESGVLPFRCEGDFTEGYVPSISYTEAIDSGEVSREEFLGLGPCGAQGYGLCQWSFSRKGFLYDQAKTMGLSVADIGVQMLVLAYEIGYSSDGTEYAETAEADTISVNNNLYGILSSVPDTPEGAQQASIAWTRLFERCQDAEGASISRWYQRGQQFWDLVELPET